MSDVAAVIAASRASAKPLALDYDHASDRPEQTERSTRAAGWIDKIEAAGPAGEPGVWAHIDWTPSGAAAVAAKEYRYLSPVFSYREGDRTITCVLRAALTNDPALQMRALASKENENVNLTALCALLGLPETATAEDVTAKIKSLQQNNAAMCTNARLIAQAAGIDVTKFETLDEKTTTALCASLKTGAATLGNAKQIVKAAGLDVTKFEVLDEAITAALCAKVKKPATAGAEGADADALRTTVDELQKQVATLSRQADGRTAEVEVANAIKNGKIIPAQKDWAIDYCTRQPEGFRKFIEQQPTILGDGSIAPSVPADGALDKDQKAMCAQMGLSEADFLKELNLQKRNA